MKEREFQIKTNSVQKPTRAAPGANDNDQAQGAIATSVEMNRVANNVGLSA